MFLGSYIFISDQNVNGKSNRNRNCIFFILYGIPRVTCWTISFMLHISVILLPLQTDTYIDELLEIFLKLSMKTVQMHLIIYPGSEVFYLDGARKKGGENLWRPLHEMQFSRDHPSVHWCLQCFPWHA